MILRCYGNKTHGVFSPSQVFIDKKVISAN